MNYKLLFTTYRNRYRFVEQRLMGQKFDQALNLGGGEGDYDAMIASYCGSLISCDINEEDVAYGRKLNSDVPNLTYQVENALQLSFADASFDLLVSVEVLEHVGQPEKMVQEISRVLKPGGTAIITCPSLDFPFTYDPINRILHALGRGHIAQGAYAFGHEYLISPRDFRQWAAKYRLDIIEDRNLGGYLVGLLEVYWTGWIQRIFKANASNLSGDKDKKITLRPSRNAPFLVFLTDAVLAIDHWLFGRRRHSIGKGFVVKKLAA